LTNTHTTPLPAAAICALVGSGIGVPLGAGDTVGAAVAVAVGAAVGLGAVVLVVVGLALAAGLSAPGAHALRRSAMTAMRVNFMLWTSMRTNALRRGLFPERPVCAAEHGAGS
jgi:hypothetical protein